MIVAMVDLVACLFRNTVYIMEHCGVWLRHSNSALCKFISWLSQTNIDQKLKSDLIFPNTPNFQIKVRHYVPQAEANSTRCRSPYDSSYGRGVCGTVASESAMRSAGTFLSRFRALPPVFLA
ncbi:hypothetical protein PoB_000318700 [Plakobranchus ocellatus]|uniref:Uncharacterized protein n=1 Tax=Plakobranchus ocellatus TaxID=259542 RepID=A0AAV3Y1T2_9GAST|nr:hypothetical protein PoB_000318700 [Plakobranchus ocellatus]